MRTTYYSQISWVELKPFDPRLDPLITQWKTMERNVTLTYAKLNKTIHDIGTETFKNIRSNIIEISKVFNVGTELKKPW